jgi:hypothetical protein
MTAARRPHASPEAAIQRAVFQHLRTRATPGVFAFHPANGGYRKPIEAAIFKGLGVVLAEGLVVPCLALLLVACVKVRKAK